jgi:hypothetical protein
MRFVGDQVSRGKRGEILEGAEASRGGDGRTRDHTCGEGGRGVIDGRDSREYVPKLRPILYRVTMMMMMMHANSFIEVIPLAHR